MGNFYGSLNPKLARDAPHALRAFSLLRAFTERAEVRMTLYDLLRDALGTAGTPEVTAAVMEDILQAWRGLHWVGAAKSRLQIVDTATSSTDEEYSWAESSDNLPRPTMRTWSRF